MRLLLLVGRYGGLQARERRLGRGGRLNVQFLVRQRQCADLRQGQRGASVGGYIDSTGNLVAAHDAAAAHLGAPWRMPTNADFAALIENCTTEWVATNGVYGRLVTGKGDYAGRSIFLPVTGFGYGLDLDNPGSCGNCWSSTTDSDDSRTAWNLYFDSGNFVQAYGDCFSGQPVRPVRDAD